MIKIKCALLLLTSLFFSISGYATVKPTVVERLSYSTVVVLATIDNIKSPYANQKVIELRINVVLAGSLNEKQVILSLLDNTPIRRGAIDFVELNNGINRVYFLKFENGEYQLSDSWFGIEQSSPELLALIRENINLVSGN